MHVYKNRVSSTYPHAILLGYAFSMIWPIIITFKDYAQSNLRKHLLFISFIMVCICLYFTESRGPWAGSLIGFFLLFTLGSNRYRKKLLLAVFLFLSVLIIRPQVTTTLSNLFHSTFDVNTLKGRSYNYRFELWYKAYDEISKSRLRLFFGYGDNSHHYLDLSGYEKATNRPSYFWSWDSEYAVILLERGILGLFAFCLLYIFVFFRTFKIYLRGSLLKKDLILSFLSGILVFLFMMTNVKVFSPQLFGLFWLIVAIVSSTRNAQEVR
ncbi:O-antigen ligase family protein [Thermodesulfobacteriota bacterium]